MGKLCWDQHPCGWMLCSACSSQGNNTVDRNLSVLPLLCAMEGALTPPGWSRDQCCEDKTSCCKTLSGSVIWQAFPAQFHSGLDTEILVRRQFQLELSDSSSLWTAAVLTEQHFLKEVCCFSLGKIDSICKWDDVISFLSALKLLKKKADSWLSL